MTEPVMTPEADNLGRIVLAQRKAYERAFKRYMRALQVYTNHTNHNMFARDRHLLRLEEGDDDGGST